MRARTTVLIISRHFPPAYDVGGKRAFRFARYLPQNGWRVVVWTSPSPPAARADPTPLSLPDSVKVVRGYTAGRNSSHGSDGTDPRPTEWPPRARLYYPLIDGELWSALRLGPGLARLAKEEGADVVMATSSPYSALLLGALTARMAGLPLCLDLRDPWSLNPMERRKPFWVRRFNQWVEHRLFRYANRILTTCGQATRAYRSLYPRLPKARWDTLLNSFDPDQRPPKKVPAGPIRLVHFGNCYGSRRLEPVMRALHRLRQRQPLKPGQLELLNLGRVAKEDLRLAEELKLKPFFRHRTVVPYQEGIELLAGADLQLLFSYAEERLFIPAKFFDYLLSGSPILCVAVASELTDLVRESGAGVSRHPRDIEGICEVLERTLEVRKLSGPLVNPGAEQMARFSAPVAAARLAEILNDIFVTSQ